MKRIIYFFLAVLVSVFTVASCTQQPPVPQVQQQPQQQIAFAARQPVFQLVDAATETLTNADTTTYTVGSFFGPMNYDIQVFADSLSGTMAGTATIQHSNAMSGSDWVTLGTVNLTGTTVANRTTGAIFGGRLRVYTITSGTQSTSLTVSALLVEDEP